MIIRKEVFHQMIAVLPVCLNDFAAGLLYGWLAPVLKLYLESDGEISATAEECSWISSLTEVGRLFGCLFGLTMNIIGRKSIIMTCSFLFFTSWIIVLFTKSILVLCLVRLMLGVAVGANDSTSPVYIAENSAPNLRGIFNSLSLSGYYFGALFEFILATYLPYHTLNICNLILSAAILASNLLLKETVQFCLQRGKTKKAERHLVWIRGASGFADVRSEFDIIHANVRQQKEMKLSWTELTTTPSNYKSLYIIFVIAFLHFATGFVALNSFISIALPSTKNMSTNQFTVLYGAIQLAMILSSLFFVERFGRRTLLLFASVISTIAHASSAVLYYLQTKTDVPAFPWLVFATIVIYASVCSAAMHPVTFTIRGELCPQKVKGIGGCGALIACGLGAFMTTKSFLLITGCCGIYWNFVMYSIISLIMLLFVYNQLPETKGKSLVEIQDLFDAKILPIKSINRFGTENKSYNF